MEQIYISEGRESEVEIPGNLERTVQGVPMTNCLGICYQANIPYKI